jgi:hypothetical protein
VLNRSIPERIDALDDDQWGRIAALHAADAQLDAASVALIRSQNPTATAAGRLSIGKRVVEDPVLRLVRTFQTSIAIDTVRNEYVLHRQLHQWLAADDVEANIEKLNDRVYAQLFLTPNSDPWLGLVPGDTYTALPNNGIGAP